MQSKFFFIFYFLFFFISFCLSEDLIKQAENLYNRNKLDDALKICNRIKQIYPLSDWDLYSRILSVKIYKKKNEIEKAINELERLIVDFKNTDYAEEAYFQIANLRRITGQKVNTIKAYETYIKNYPNGKYVILAIFNLAMIYKEDANYTEALKRFNEILQNYNKDIWFYNWAAIYSGHIYAEKKNYDKALEYYDRVIKVSNDDILYGLSNLYKGKIFLNKKEYDKAKNIFNLILKTSNSFTQEAMLGLADTYFAAGEYDLAEQVYITILDMYPDTIWKNLIEKKLKNLKR